MTRSNNEAAEQLHNLLDTYIKADLRPHAHQAADAALAIERRATVEQAKRALLFVRTRQGKPPESMRVVDVLAILDEVAGSGDTSS